MEAMTPQQVYQALQDTVPMNKTLALKPGVMTETEFGMILPVDPAYSNHLAGPHAGAMFTLAEATSGGVAFLAFGKQLMAMRPVVRTAECAYVKFMKGEVHSVGIIDAAARDQALEDIKNEGKARMMVEVTVRNADGEVGLECKFEWAFKKMG